MKQPLTKQQVLDRLSAFDVAIKALENEKTEEAAKLMKSFTSLRNTFYETHHNKIVD